MAAKLIVLLACMIAVCSAGLIPAAPAAFAAPVVPAAVPAAALTVGTYASSYNAHAINHAVAAPYVAAYSAVPAVPAVHAVHAVHALPAAYTGALIAGRR